MCYVLSKKEQLAHATQGLARNQLTISHDAGKPGNGEKSPPRSQPAAHQLHDAVEPCAIGRIQHRSPRPARLHEHRLLMAQPCKALLRMVGTPSALAHAYLPSAVVRARRSGGDPSPRPCSAGSPPETQLRPS